MHEETHNQPRLNYTCHYKILLFDASCTTNYHATSNNSYNIDKSVTPTYIYLAVDFNEKLHEGMDKP